MFSKTLLAALLPALASASSPPGYGGWNLIWSDGFFGNAGQAPSGANWNIAQGDPGVNNELEVYTSSSANVQLSGGNTLQLVPWNNGSYTSGKIESKYVFTPTDGKVTRVEASLRHGGNPESTKQGIWPAFWMLGDSIRHGTPWPECGELDIMEMVSGHKTGYGTAHCDVSPGGICNEGSGLGASIGVPNYDWHTWRIDVDLQPGDWTQEAISWSMDGNVYHRIFGRDIGNYDVWHSLAHSPLYFILNVAIGGNWPGNPNGATQFGYGAMMEASYVAHYTT